MNAFELSAVLSLNADKFNKGIKSAESGFQSFGKRLTGIAGKITAIYGAVSSAAIVSIAKASISAYADTEQLVGGVETLYKDSSKTVKAYAANAYRDAGVSANKYMEMSTSFAASLISSLGGDTDRAAELANTAIVDMSDNANKMGTDLTSIQNAYNGFAKQNFTMLDNLKLGYGGTKKEMERLLKDASQLTGKNFDINKYSDIVEAIHAVQDNMGITGTTAKEASTTIQGSVSMMKNSWQDLLSALTNPNASPELAIRKFVGSTKTMLNNVLPAVKTFMSNLGDAVKEIAPIIGKELPGIISDFLPKFIVAGGELISGLWSGIRLAAQKLKPKLPEIFQSILTGALTLLADIGNGIIDFINETFDIKIPEIDLSFISNAFQWFVDNKQAVVTAVGAIIAAFAAGKIAEFVSSLSPMKLLFYGISAAILAVANNWDKIKEWIGKTWETVVTWANEKWEDISAAFENVKAWLREKRDAVVKWAVEKWEDVKNAFDNAKKWAAEKRDAVVKWATEKWEEVTSAFNNAKKWAAEKRDAVVTWAAEKWVDVQTTFNNVKDWLAEKRDATVTWISAKLDDVKAGFDTVKAWIDEKRDAAVTWLRSSTEAVKEGFDAVAGWIKEKREAAVTWFAENFPEVSAAFDSVRSWIGEKREALVNWVNDNWKDVSGAFSEVGKWVSEKAHNISVSWHSTVDEWFNKAKDWIGNTANNISLDFKSTVSEWIERIKDWLAGKGLPKITLNIGAQIGEWIQRIYDWVTNGISVSVKFFGSMFGGGDGKGDWGDTPQDQMWSGFSGGSVAPKAIGDWNVPYDNFPALLHRNEMVLTASQARRYRNGEVGGASAQDIASAVRSAVMDLAFVSNGETIGRVIGDQTTNRVNRNIGQMSRRHRYGYGG